MNTSSGLGGAFAFVAFLTLMSGYNPENSAPVDELRLQERRAEQELGQAAELKRLRLIADGTEPLEAYCISHAHLRTKSQLRRVECSSEAVSRAGVSIFDS